MSDTSLFQQDDQDVAHVVTIREAEFHDADDMLPLLEQLGYPETSMEQLQYFLSHHLDDNNKVWVAEKSQHIVGFAVLHIIPCLHAPKPLARITSLVVDEDVRCCGVGHHLMEVIEDYARQMDCHRIELTSGRHRGAAHQFYETHGYELSPKFYFAKMIDE